MKNPLFPLQSSSIKAIFQISSICLPRRITLPHCHVNARLLSSVSEHADEVPRTHIHSYQEQISQPSAVLNKFLNYSETDFRQYIEPLMKVEFVEQLKLFDDYSLLMRKPYLDILKDLIEIRSAQTNTANLDDNLSSVNLAGRCIPRFVAYGQPGTGISTILGQILCFAGSNDWLVFPFIEAERWLEDSYDHTPSGEYHNNQHKPHLIGDAFDFPNRSSEWLKYFKAMNEKLINKLQPTISRPVEWTKKDSMLPGTPWSELIDFGITRSKYSTDCIGILLREMRKLCSQPDGPASLILIDGVNFMWCRGTRLRDQTLRVSIAPDRFALVHHLKRAMQGDWRHGAILTSTNIRAAWATDREKYTPGYLLGKLGFETMDPFIPVHVENYTPVEVDAMLRFYKSHNWLANPAALTPEGRAEILFLADNNPLELDRVAAEW